MKCDLSFHTLSLLVHYLFVRRDYPRGPDRRSSKTKDNETQNHGLNLLRPKSEARQTPFKGAARGGGVVEGPGLGWGWMCKLGVLLGGRGKEGERGEGRG